MSDGIFSSITSQLPPFLTRRDVSRYFGNLISPRYLANLDSQGQGPKKTYCGRKVVYASTDFIEWLSRRTGWSS